MKKLLARIKQWNNLNAGLTLVEIIVTMLILVIIALPILGGFITAARANAMAKDLAYARDAAENVVEVANSGGKLEDKFGLAGWGCTVSGNPEEDDSFSYTLTGVRSGTGTYTAVLECNKTKYQDANNYVLPDMSALDSEQTVVIFPESNFYKFKDDGTLEDATNLHRFDTTAISDFYRDYHDSVVDIYNNIVYGAYLDEVKRIEQENKEIAMQPTPSPTLAPPVMPEYPAVIRKEDVALATGEEPIKSFIHRTIDMKVVYSPSVEADDEDHVQASVSTEYSYVMRDGSATGTLDDMVKASFTQYRGSDYDYLDDTALDAAIADLVVRLKESKSYAVAAETTVDTLDNLYIVTYPFNAVDGQIKDYNTLALTTEVRAGVDVHYLNDKEVNVFLVIQEDGEYTPGTSDFFNLILTNGSIFQLYSQMGLLVPDGAEAPSSTNSELYNERENTTGNVLLDVTVKLYSPDNVTAGQELTEVKTTVSSKK